MDAIGHSIQTRALQVLHLVHAHPFKNRAPPPRRITWDIFGQKAFIISKVFCETIFFFADQLPVIGMQYAGPH